MKKLSIILVVTLLAGCANMGMGRGSGTSGTDGMGSTNQMDINRHDNPSDIYFGG
jgi:hypothetical protein